MSICGDYKAGLLDDSQYTRECNDEARRLELIEWNEEEIFKDDEIDEF